MLQCRQRRADAPARRYTLHQSIIRVLLRGQFPARFYRIPSSFASCSAQCVLDACKRYPNPCPSDSLSVDGQSARCVIRHVSGE